MPVVSSPNHRFAKPLLYTTIGMVSGPVLSDSLDSTCGPYIFTCLVTTCLYTTLGMASPLMRSCLIEGGHIGMEDALELLI
jgi:hypothetical protein